VRALASAELALRAGATLAEGPRWDAARGRLLWVDIEAGELHRFDPATGEDRSLALGAKVGCVAPAADGRVIAALADRLAMVDPDAGGVEDLVELPQPGPGRRANDGACDPAGRFWVGTMAEDEAPGRGALYRYDPDGTLHTVLPEVTLSNGIGWGPDETRMYYVDSPTQRIDLLDFDPSTGATANRRPFAHIGAEDGTPDGLAVDHDGGVWVALWGGRQVRRYRVDGELDGIVEVPAENVTACAFGGPAGDLLFVTTSSQGVPPERRGLAGSLFVAETGFSGPPATPFAG
jgi:sugar lactone lactonase YvrE